MISPLHSQDYDFEYEDDEDMMDDDEADAEKQYYNAKAMKDEDARQAIDMMQSIVDKESGPTEWAFKALKQQTKLLLSLREHDRALEKYRQLLPYTQTCITPNHA